MSATRFSADYGKRAAGCKKCKQPLAKGSLRVAKIVPNPFSESTDEMRNYYHVDCIFEMFSKARANTAVVESVSDIEGFSDLSEADKKIIVEKLQELEKLRAEKAGPGSKSKQSAPPKKQAKLDKDFGISPKKSAVTKTSADTPAKLQTSSVVSQDAGNSETTVDADPGKDDNWLQFCKLCERISKTSKYTEKTNVIENYITKGTNGKYDGNLYLLFKMLLPGTDQRVYNLKDKQLLKLFSNIFDTSLEKMQDHLNQNGDVSATISHFYSASTLPNASDAGGQLTLQSVEKWLVDLAGCTREADHEVKLRNIVKKCNPTELCHIIRQIKKDLRMNAGAPNVLKALDPNAYEAFQNLRDLKKVVQKVIDNKANPSPSRALSITMKAGTPIKPMLAEACRSVSQAMAKCAHGMYAEIKYDGERVQVHRAQQSFACYSRSLKPVQGHKVANIDTHFSQAFSSSCGQGDLVLDAEVLLVDNATGKPLPFGTLGVHKQKAFTDANVCLFVFDMLMYDGKDLLNTPLCERKRLLHEHMTEVPNRIMYSSYEFIKHGDNAKLKSMIDRAIAEGLEGLVLKDTRGTYEPGKRRWLKVKKDYLEAGSLADTADLVVLGAYYGSGSKGGLMSVFLMGVQDKKSGKWCTVTKCGNGHDDDTLDKINRALKSGMTEINRDHASIPTWLKCNRSLTPDFIINDPKLAPVWEITGAEFSKSEAHTADGISIRFPRVTKIRDDKTWKEATNLDELKNLFAKSKEKSDFLDEPSISSPVKPSSSESGGLNAQLNQWLDKDDQNNSVGSNSKLDTSGSGSERKPKKRPSRTENRDEETPVKKARKNGPDLTKIQGSEKDDRKNSVGSNSKLDTPGSGSERKRKNRPLWTENRDEETPVKKARKDDPDQTKIQGSDKDDQNDSVGSSSKLDTPVSESERKPKKYPSPTENRNKDSPVKKACKYGLDCYQHSDEHRQKFSHPEQSDRVISKKSPKSKSEECTKTSSDTNNSVANAKDDSIFSGLQFALAENFEKSMAKKLRQQVCYFGGDVVDSFSESDFVLSDGKSELKTEDFGMATVVSPEFVFDSVKKGTLLKVKGYLI